MTQLVLDQWGKVPLSGRRKGIAYRMDPYIDTVHLRLGLGCQDCEDRQGSKGNRKCSSTYGNNPFSR